MKAKARLSILQRTVLAIALENAQGGNPTSLRQVVALLLGVSDCDDPFVQARGRVFRKSAAGYNAAMASASRAVRRLEIRGLVYRHAVARGCGLFCLTSLGATVAQGLTVSVSRPATARGKRSKGSRKPKLLTQELPTVLATKRLSRAEIEAAKDVDWRPVP